MCFTSSQGTCAKKLFTGRLLGSAETIVNADENSPAVQAVFVGASCDSTGRPTVEADNVNGTGARALTVSDLVDLYGDCPLGCIHVWACGEDDEEAK